MRPPSPTAEALAGRLLVAASAPRSGEAEPTPAAAAERAFRGVADSLARWFGPFGYHAILVRALAQARREHPALAAVTVGEALAPTLDGLAEAATEHGADAAIEGARALLTAVIALLGRVVGDDMVLYLVEPRMDDTSPADPRPS